MKRLLLFAWAALLPQMAAADTIDLSVTTGDTHVLGPDGYTYMGYSVAQGDVNGDGLADMVMGVPYASPEGRATAGKVYVVYGDSNLAASVDLSASGSFAVIYGELAGGQLGRRVATGNVNGDAYDDIIIAASLLDPPGLSNAGRVYVLHGGPTLADTTDLAVTAAAVTLTGGADHQIGTGLGAGDISGDGLDDLVIGASEAEAYGRSRAGRVHILYSPLSATYDLNLTAADLVVTGRDADDRLGNDLVVADFDTNGKADVAMAAFKADAGGITFAGEVNILTGDDDYAHTFYDLATQNTRIMATIRGDAVSDQAGYAVAAGDVNYDGIPDLAIGANTAEASGSPNNSGIVYVVDGSTLTGILDLGEPADVFTEIWGTENGSNLGFSVEILNANGDGMGDLLIGEPLTGGQTGKVYLVAGDQVMPASIDLATVDADRKILGAAAGDNTGFDVAGGDIDGDGIEDLIIGVAGGAGTSAGSGEVVVLLDSPPQIHLSPADTTGRYGSTTNVPVRVDSTTGMKMVEVDLDLLYDGDVLAVTGIDTAGALTAGWDTITFSSVDGGANLDTIRIHGRTLGASASDTGALFDVTVDVTQIPLPDTSALLIDHVLFNRGDPDWNVPSPGQLVVIGTDAQLAATILSTPGDTIRVRAIELDANTDTTMIQTLAATVTSARTGEVETLQLTELSIDDSVFFGALPTLAAPGAGPDNDGTMQVADDDTLFVSVTDSLDASGQATLRQTDHLVIDPLGDADDNGLLQAFDASRILRHAAGLLTLSGRDSLAANVDEEAPGGVINSFDAVLVIQRALGLIERFPVQADSAANHPQPETDASVPKRLPDVIALSWRVDGTDLVLHADERQRIQAGDLRIDGLPAAVTVAPAADLPEAQLAYDTDEDHLIVALAIPHAAQDAGELLRIQPRAGEQLPDPVKLTVEGQLNGGTLAVRAQAPISSTSATPRVLQLHPNHPNPFNAQTAIRFDLPQAGFVNLSIYNSVGQHVRTLVADPRSAGRHQIVWDGTTDTGQRVASGTYVYALTADGLRITRRLLLLK